MTGAAGFIGSHLCDALLHRHHEVVGVDCFTGYYDRALKEANLVTAQAQRRFTFVEADLRSDDLLPILRGADVVVNEAATPGLALSWEAFEQYQSCNLSAVERVIEACIACGVGHLVQASTSSVYGAEAVGDEDSPTFPVSPYGVTKLAAEHLLRAHSEAYGLPVTILRYFSIYGPRQRPDMAYRIFCEKLIEGRPVTVYGDGGQSRSNTYIDDCVAATIAAVERQDMGPTWRGATQILNVGGGREITLLDALGVLADELGVRPVVRHEPARKGDQRRTVADAGRAASVLDWKPAVEPEEGLRQQARWARDLAQR